MMTNRKRLNLLVAAALVASLCLSSQSGCSRTEKKDGGQEKESYTFETIFTDETTQELAQYNPSEPTGNGEATYEILKNVGDKNYMRICLDTDVNLVGYITYSNMDDPKESNKEKFYIEAGEEEFTMFLDAYRTGAFGAYQKTIESISLQNVDETKDGTVTLKSVDFSDRSYEPDKMMYIDDGTLKVGTSLAFGGAITYIARLSGNIKEYVDAEGNTRIGRLLDTDGVDVISEESNLVNTYDLGREIQQSFYWPVKEQHGYVPTSEKKYPGDLNYNPIQCGSAGSVGPQIVDYHCSEDEIYVKAYGQDWYLVNQVDPTYFETWFTFGEDGVLIVKNKMTNFAQFTNTESLDFVGQESPAFYSVYPLNYFYAETKQGTVFDENLCAMGTGGRVKTSANESVSGNYYYSLPAEQVKDGWVAFVTEEKFGLGIYNPTADYYNASRGFTSIAYNDKNNNMTHPEFYEDDYSSYVPSCYANNYDYVSTAINCKMVDFVPLEFSYAIYAGNVAEMRSAFKQLAASGKLVKEEIAWPTNKME